LSFKYVSLRNVSIFAQNICSRIKNGDFARAIIIFPTDTGSPNTALRDASPARLVLGVHGQFQKMQKSLLTHAK